MSTSIDIHNCEIGSVTSRQDHSVKFWVNTPELKVSEAGELMQWHGRSCRVILFPHGAEPEEKITVKTAKAGKSPSQRMRAAFYALHQHRELSEPFEAWYESQMATLITAITAQIE